ncbi:SRPBCC family protein [Falsihalocynthiibacter sp. SS001]|uniref:SRPBCC family protein n=1 Tax=Falsihalocynthiibacter sp. SS001 TaxID=3349698 RepID=UPI0036D2AE81
MKFEAIKDIEAPVDLVFRAVSDFAHMERAALRRGLEVQPLAQSDLDGALKGWKMRFVFRNKPRNATTRLIEITANHGYIVEGICGGIHGTAVVDVVPLSKKRTRLKIAVDTKAKTLSARLVLQSLKIARKRLQQKFLKRIGKLAQELEDGFQTGRLI